MSTSDVKRYTRCRKEKHYMKKIFGFTLFIIITAFFSFPLSAAQWDVYGSDGIDDMLNANAKYGLAVKYSNGDGVEKNAQKAFELFVEAAELGHAAAQAHIGSMYLSIKDFDLALKWLQKAAEAGDLNAQYEIAVMYAAGDGVEKDIWKAMDLLYKTAEAGNIKAQYEIGLLYYNGDGVEKDYATAMQWFMKAANQRHYGAQEVIGNMYLKGEGVEKDEIEGLAWLYLGQYGKNFESDAVSRITEQLGAEAAQVALQRSEELRQIVNLSVQARSGIPLPVPAGNPIGSGAGVVISRDGLVLASANIVAAAGSVSIKTSTATGQTFPAAILEIDNNNNLAILKYESSSLPLAVASSEHIMIDQNVRVLLPPPPADVFMTSEFLSAKIKSLAGTGNDPGYFKIGRNPITPAQAAAGDTQYQGLVERLLNAGGQVFDDSGNFIGMIQPQEANNDGFITVLGSEAMRPLLKKYGVEVNEKSENETENSGGQNAASSAHKVMSMSNFRSIVMVLAY